VDLIVQNDGSSWIQHSGGYGIIANIAGSFDVANYLQFSEEEKVPDRPFEKTTVLYSAKIVDEDFVQIPLTEIEAMTLQVFDSLSGTILRETQDVLNANDVAITEDSNNTILTWIAQVEDTKLTSIANVSETHIALFQTAWDSGSTGSLSGPFAMTDTSSTVRVTLASHGLSSTADHHVFFNDSVKVGGLLIAGAYAITSIVDANTFDIDARCPATSTASGGGTVNYWLNPKTAKHTVKLTVKRIEPTCG
jgi:hypothetical protein